MTNTMSFPLCLLPSVACDCVVKQMPVREKYFLTTLSERAREAVRVALLREVYTINVRQGLFFCVIDLTSNPLTEDWLYLYVIRNGSGNDLPGKDPVMWTDDLGSTLAVELESMHEVFKCSGISVSSDCYETAFDDLKHVVPVIKKLKLNILKATFDSIKVDDNLFEFVMESFKDADTLRNFLATSPGYEWKQTEPFNNRRCTISAPVPMEHLTRLFMNCRFFEQYNRDPQITAESLNGFLKKWMDRSALEYVKFRFRTKPDLRSIVDGIENAPVRQAFIRNRLEEFDDGEAVKIRQNSGKEAVACVLYNNNFVLTTKFDDPKSDLWTDDSDAEFDDNEEEDAEANDGNDEYE